MRALLLAAGPGTRLRPLTDLLPKCLAPIKGRPLIEYWMNILRRSDIERMLVNTHYLPELVAEVVNENPASKLTQLVHEPQLLGTGGTIRANKAFCSGTDVLVAHADNLSVFDPADFVKAHRARPDGTNITMMTFRTTTPQSCGIVVADERGVVREFHEKVASPPGNTANAAVYVFGPEAIDFVSGFKKSFVDLSTEVIPEFIGRIYCYPNRGYHCDIGTIAAWRQANAEYAGSVPDAPDPDPWSRILERQGGNLRRHIDGLLPKRAH